MKTVFNMLNIIYFILIIITIIILIYYINKYYLKKEKFTENNDTLKCEYIYNKKVLMETCRDLKGKLVKSNTYITNNKEDIVLPEDINDIFINDEPNKKCEVMGKSDDIIIAQCCPNNGADPKLCVSNSYVNLKNKNVL